MSAAWYTEESARAAFALGPTRAACNVCGKRHLFELNAMLQATEQCRYERAGQGVIEIYTTHGAELENMRRLTRGIRSYYASEPFQHSAKGKPVQYAEVGRRLTFLEAVLRLLCAGGRELSFNLWRGQQHRFEYLEPPYAAMDSISPWYSASSWLLMLSPEGAHRAIAHVVLGLLRDKHFWGEMRQLFSSAELTPLGARYIIMQHDEANALKNIIAARAGLRDCEGVIA